MVKYANTLKTTVGFVRSVLARFLPFLARNERLDDIYNFLEIEDVYSTSGQPSESQFHLIKEAGHKLVVNLAPTSMLENSVVEEANILQELGLEYVHIPVVWESPTLEELEEFFKTMKLLKMDLKDLEEIYKKQMNGKAE